MNKIGLLFAFITLLAAFKSHGRAPAVEPIKEINTEHYNDVPPSKAKGFNFEKPVVKRKPARVPRKIENSKNVQGQNHMTDEPGLKSSFTLFAFAILLPFAVWYGAMRSFKDNEKIKRDLDNVHEFPANNNDDDDSNLAA